MYSDIPIYPIANSAYKGSSSVLSSFPTEASHAVVVSVVKTVASQLGLQVAPSNCDLSNATSAEQTVQPNPVTLKNESQIVWFMEVVCHGLSLPLGDHEVIKDCVNIYCEWLSALLPNPKSCVPEPILQEPNRYARKIIAHLSNIFFPRKEEAQEIHRQAVLCHRVLRRIQDIVKNSLILEKDTWESVLAFLLSINDALLAPPAVPEDVGDQMCERVLGVLYEIWLEACVKCFPSPPLWKAFRENCCNWRHRSGLVEQWSRTSLSLTRKLLDFMSPSRMATRKETSSVVIPKDMSKDCIAQTWFRFIHSLGNPVEFSKPQSIAQTQYFLQYAIVAENVIEPSNHPCLAALPDIFLKAMRGISAMVDAFLGVSDNQNFTSSQSPKTSGLMPDNRAKCNSILHVFGNWLFEASFVGCEPKLPDGQNQLPTEPNWKRSNQFDGAQSNTFESGRAEALGTLCRILCAKKTGEEILPAYLARFYLAVQCALSESNGNVINELTAQIILNSSELFGLDLDGVHILLPCFTNSLAYLTHPQKELKVPRNLHVSTTELRRSGIKLLISMMSYPHHFDDLLVSDLIPASKPMASHQAVNFAALKESLVKTLIDSLCVETEADNVHMLLGGLSLLMQDATSLDRERKSDKAEEKFISQTANLVCKRLNSSWISDLSISIAALEFLLSVARLSLPGYDRTESKGTVKWLCDFIATQSARHKKDHSRDLHSCLVAAFSTLKTWLFEHSYLLKDKQCVTTVFQVIELGISGSKSSGDVLKEEKLLSPASRRVKDAAEGLLNFMLEQVELFPSSVGPESLSTLFSEVNLAHYTKHLGDSDVGMRMCDAVGQFKYFVVDNSSILAVCEGQPESSIDEQEPTVSLLLRTPYSRSAWSVKLRQLPRHKSTMNTSSLDPGRPLSLSETGTKSFVHSKYFPSEIDNVPLCKADRSIPAVESVAGNERASRNLEQLSQLMDQQATLEEQSVYRLEENSAELSRTAQFECRAPEPCQNFQTARLILSHLGLMNMSRLVYLDSAATSFVNDLEILDAASPRTTDTVFVFCAKSGQKHAADILNNVNSVNSIHPYFMDFLFSLGWPVNCWSHPGWTGHVSTSWRVQVEPIRPPDLAAHGGAAFNGDHYLLYWSDAASEIAFVVPTENKTRASDGVAAPPALQRQVSSTSVQQEVKVLVIWVERMEDTRSIDIDGLLASTSTGRDEDDSKCYFVIYVHPMKNGLLRIKMATSATYSTIPLIDGMIVSRENLGPLIRQTALNVANRHRLETDSSQPPPHIQRRFKIQEIAKNYRSKMVEAELFAQLFV